MARIETVIAEVLVLIVDDDGKLITTLIDRNMPYRKEFSKIKIAPGSDEWDDYQKRYEALCDECPIMLERHVKQVRACGLWAFTITELNDGTRIILHDLFIGSYYWSALLNDEYE